MLPVLDFSSVKDELFPPIASVFAKTSSLLIKVRGLQSFVILCGGTNEPASSDDDLSGIVSEARPKVSASTSILDKYTIQEKLVPLLKSIRTKEPAVMMAALKVFQQIGQVADVEFVALEILPILWNFSLGPLLNVQQFTSFMELIKSLSSKVERDHTRKLQELASANGTTSKGADSTFGGLHMTGDGGVDGGTSDFERLVLGKTQDAKPVENVWGVWESSRSPKSATACVNMPQFSWSLTPQPMSPSKPATPTARINSNPRSVTPDMNMTSFPTLQSAARQQVSSFPSLQPTTTSSCNSSGTGMGQNAQFANSSNFSSATGIMSQGPSSFAIPPPPSINALPSHNTSLFGQANFQMPDLNSGMQTTQMTAGQQQKQGLDKYESLL